MNKEKKELLCQFINKKYILSFFIISISIFFFIKPIFEKINSKLIIKIIPNSFVNFTVQNHYREIIKFPIENEWLIEKNLLV